MTAATTQIPAVRTPRRLPGRLAVTGKYVSLVVGSIVAVLPLTVILLASLKTKQELEQQGPFDLPGSPQWENYAVFWDKGRALEGFMNTGIILAASIVGTIIIGTMAAYALDRFEFRFRKSIVMLFLLATLVPGVTTQVATFQIVHGLGVHNTRLAPILLFMGTDIISIYIFIQFMRGIPKELDEAAFLDGANHWTIYRRVIFPLLKPAIVTVVIIKGIAIYNEFYIPFLYMPDRNLPVISTALFRFKGPFAAEWQVISAGIVVVVVPTLIIFLLLQRYIYNGLTQGAVK